MEIKHFNVGHVKFTFVCNWRNTRNGFAHDVSMFVDEQLECSAKNTVNYINRTWESWQYQTAIHGLIMNEIEERKDIAIFNWKSENDIKRVTAKRRPELEAFLDKQKKEDLIWKTLLALDEQVMYGRR